MARDRMQRQITDCQKMDRQKKTQRQKTERQKLDTPRNRCLQRQRNNQRPFPAELCAPPAEIISPQNAILSEFESPRRPVVAVISSSVGEWLSLVEHLVRDTTEHRDLKSKPLIRRCFKHRDPNGNLLRLVPSLSPSSATVHAPNPHREAVENAEPNRPLVG